MFLDPPCSTHSSVLEAHSGGLTAQLALRVPRFVNDSRSAGLAREGGLLPHVFRILVHGDSRNRSCKLPRRRKKDGVVRGVGQHGYHCLGQRNAAGGILETAGSASDL